MLFDQVAIHDAQRRAYNTLASKYIKINDFSDSGEPIERWELNANYTPGLNVTAPAEIIQEQPFVNTVNQYTFDFSLTAPVPSATLNNRLLGKNNRFQSYGIKILIGEGSNANNRIYRSRGVIQNDDSLYNSNIAVKYEQSTYQDFIIGRNFRDVVNAGADEYGETSGLVLINPQRVSNGSMGVYQVLLTLNNSISTLVLTPNLFISVRLVGAIGQAQGGI